MSKKHKGGAAPVPAANQSHFGPHQPVANEVRPKSSASKVDPKRRLGNDATAGEHALEGPGGKQGANR